MSAPTADRPLPAPGPGLAVDDFVQLFDAGRLDHTRAWEFSVGERAFAGAALDPLSAGYRDEVLRLWGQLTGRRTYDPAADETFELDQPQFLARPYPYSAGDPIAVGQYLGAVAWFLRQLEPRPDQHVVELGSGWGHLAMSLAMLGCNTTAVDLNPASVTLLRTRAAAWGVPLTVQESAFLDFQASEVDLLIFFESFHHCDDPVALLTRCSDALTPNGRMAFLAEAVYDDFYCPWGVRLDGDAAFMARHAGWLELGFSTSFFLRQLLELGFVVDRQADAELGAYGTLIVAQRGCAGEVLDHELPHDEAVTWGPRLPGLRGRLATEASRVTLPSDPSLDEIEVTLDNLGAESVRVQLGAGAGEQLVVVGAGDRVVCTVELGAGRRTLVVSSDRTPAPALGLASTGVLVTSLGT